MQTAEQLVHHHGGTLIMHGEREASSTLQQAFKLGWKMEGAFCRRTHHVLNTHEMLQQVDGRMRQDQNADGMMWPSIFPLPPALNV